MGFKKFVKSVGRAAAFVAAPVVNAVNKAVVNPATNFGDSIVKLGENTAQTLKSTQDPNHAIGASTTLTYNKSEVETLQRNKEIQSAADNSRNVVAQKTAATKAEEAKTKMSSTEQDLERKSGGRAATLLTGPTGLNPSEFKLSRRMLLGF